MKMKYFLICALSLSLSSCCLPPYGWEDVCVGCKKQGFGKKKSDFSFVPLYDEDDVPHQSATLYDSKEELLYTNNQTSTTFRKINFSTDSYAIKGEANIASLKNIITFMKKNPKTILYIEGHTDERGAASYNLSLGSRRANAVKSYLIKQGIAADRLFTVSYGKELPTNKAHNELAWQQNRRTEFKVHAK